MLAVFLVIAGMALSMSSCMEWFDRHEHAYTANVIAPTCTSAGYTEHTCSCGDTYRDSETAKLNHQTTVTYEFPTTSEKGSKTTVCSVCNHTAVEEIESMLAANPKAYDLLAALIGQVEYTLKVKENSEFTYVVESDNESEYPGSTTTVTIEFLEAELNDIPEGRLDLGFIVSELCEGKTNVNQFQLHLYLLEDVVQFSIEQNWQGYSYDVSLNDLFYEMIGGMMGVEKDEAVEILYFFTQLADCLPIAEGILGAVAGELPVISDEFINEIVGALELVYDDILIETVNADGSTTYKVDLAALNHLLDLVDEDQSLASYFGDLFGKEYVDDALAFIESIPDRTVREISEAVISISETTGASVDELYYAIDFFVYMSSGEKISMEKEIFDRYDLTVAELLAEVGEVPADETDAFIDRMHDAFAQITTMMEHATVGDLIESMFANNSEGSVSIIETLKATADQLAVLVDLELTVDAEGNLVALNGNFGGGYFVVDFINNSNVVKITVILPDGTELAIDVIDGVASLTVKQNGEVLASGTITVDEIVNGSDVTNRITVSLSNGADVVEFVIDVTDNGAALVLKQNGEVLASGAITAEEIVDGSNVTNKITATLGDGAFDIEFSLEQYLTDGVPAGIAWVFKTYENGIVNDNLSVKISGGDNAVAYEIYAEVDGEVLIDAGVSLTAENNGAKTEYTLSLDFGKLILGTTPIYEEVYETDENGYIVYWDYVVVAYKTATLSGSTEITFSSER